MSLTARNSIPSVGDCECCDLTAVRVILRDGITMCDDCYSKMMAVVPTHTVAEIQAIDSLVVSRSDTPSAKTVATVELRAAIEHDSTIPDDQKDFAYAKAVQERMQHFQRVEFDARAAAKEAAEMAREYQTACQVAVGKLRPELRLQFVAQDMNYTPVKPKTVKSPKVPTVSSFSSRARHELNDACKKYDVPAQRVRLVQLQHNCSADEAAQIYARSIGKL